MGAEFISLRKQEVGKIRCSIFDLIEKNLGLKTPNEDVKSFFPNPNLALTYLN